LAILIPAGTRGLISITVAVVLHEASELMAVANGLIGFGDSDGYFDITFQLSNYIMKN
jgi:hypothetical protein